MMREDWLPTIAAKAGTLPLITLPAPIIAPSPILHPSTKTVFVPIQTFRSTITGLYTCELSYGKRLPL